MSSSHVQNEKAHFTYKTHLDLQKLKDLMLTFGELKLFSFVHEKGDVDEDVATPYEHTHVFVWWKKGLNITDSRVWDINEIHPSITTKRSVVWAQHVCTVDHRGHKVKANGTKYFIEPTFIHQEGVEECNFETSLMSAVVTAPTLSEACEYGGITPKRAVNISSRRRDQARRSFAEVENDCTKPWIPPPEDWDPRKQTLVLHGPPNIGKTNWAIAQFKFPFECTNLEDLKDIPVGCDGIVFDNIDVKCLPMNTQKMVTDVRKACTIPVRRSNVFKPHLPAIWSTNELDQCFNLEGPESAVRTRVYAWKVDKMFIE